MKKYDVVSSLFWLSLSVAVCIDSLRMGVGTVWNPGMGFIGFGAAGLLGLLSVVLLVQALLRKEKGDLPSAFSGRLVYRVVFTFVALVLYAWLMPIVGYLVSTFVLMTFLFGLLKEDQRWWWSPISSLLVTVTTYLIFSVWLNGQYPEGLFGF